MTATYANIDEPEAIRMVRYAIDHGVNYLDTAYPYHGGNSERFVGRALQDGYRDKVKLATKLPCWVVESRRGLRPAARRAAREAADRPHRLLPAARAEQGDSWPKCATWACSTGPRGRSPTGASAIWASRSTTSSTSFKEIVDAYDGWTFCQIQYNYMDIENQAGTKGLQYAASRGWPSSSWSRCWAAGWSNPPEPIQALWDTAAAEAHAADWALQWLWNQPEVSVVLSGMSTMEQVEQNVASAGALGCRHA